MRLIDYFNKGLERDPERIAFIDPDVTLRYKDVDQLSRQLASGIHALGVAQGASVAVLSPNSAMAFVCILGAVRMGGVWVPVNVRNPEAVNAHFLKLAGCELVFVHSSLAGGIPAMKAQV
ncbi:MAG: class I adenylate-forming enzyme family protein, partial [Burkholderiaceae bacterium]|nr:class I adenylate-forming enzyme family protein [Burkholderiaceae bacterium]